MDFYFDKVLQPGQAGVIRVHIETKDLAPGPLERTYELQTNDPKHRFLQVTVTATIQPLPAFVKRITNADIQHGEAAGPFVVWPAAQPVVMTEKGERLPISLRIRPAAPNQSVKLAAASDGVKLTREANGEGYVLDVMVESPADAPTRVLPLVVNVEGGEPLKLQVTAKVQAEGLVTSSRQVDFGEVSLAGLQGGAGAMTRLGVRKQVGTFEVKAVSSSLEFLKVESQTIVPGSNYVIYIRFDPTKLPKPATYIGTLRVETTDAAQPRLELPIKVVVTK
ncbi:MAG TPA: hypothetical protein VJZ91_14885 [Blastocatellia bacterium]|nr:hypothetical protein [Blastocatellia bacterium]